VDAVTNLRVLAPRNYLETVKAPQYEDGRLLGCYAVLPGRSFRDAYCLHYRPDDRGRSTCETSVPSYQSTRRNNLEDGHLRTCRSENLKSHVSIVVFIVTPSSILRRYRSFRGTQSAFL
jgi:hypothetical protein